MTTLRSHDQGGILGVRVLAQSLREEDADADLVVLVDGELATENTLKALGRDGLAVGC